MGIVGFSSGVPVIRASVVGTMLAIETAFWTAERVPLTGSGTDPIAHGLVIEIEEATNVANGEAIDVRLAGIRGLFQAGRRAACAGGVAVVAHLRAEALAASAGEALVDPQVFYVAASLVPDVRHAFLALGPAWRNQVQTSEQS